MESRGNSRLTIRQGPVPGKVHDLAKDVVTLGRDVSNDIVINDAEVSRNHARLTAQSGSYLIEDLASTNGTFVNGQRLIGPKLLNAGDVVGLGETVVLEYGVVASDAGATVIAASPMRGMPEPVTAPPQMPEPEPQPMYTPEPAAVPQTMAEPMMAAPPPSPAPPPPAPLPQKASSNNRTWAYVGGGCGCLTLCACLAAVAYYAYTSGLLTR
jgi:predicted component of type VI protein secretion system